MNTWYGIVFKVSTYGLDPRVELGDQAINVLAGQGDPARMKPVPHGSIGRWRVGSGSVRPGDIEKSRVGSGRIGSEDF